MSQRPVVQNPKNKFKKYVGKGKKVRQESRKCFFCKKKGHLRADCYGWKALKKKEGMDTPETIDHTKSTNMKLVWPGALGDTNDPPVPIRMSWSQGDSCSAKHNIHDWMLDSGAGAHVCVDGGSFVKLTRDPMMALDWQGGVDVNEYSGLIRLRVANTKLLELPGTRYAPDGATNLISQRILERTGWKPSYSDTDDEQSRVKYFDKDGVRLEFTKGADGFYWMKSCPVLEAALMMARSVETLEDNIAMKLHLKLAHLNEAAMKKMVKDGLANGMSGLMVDDFKKTPLKCIACEEAKAKRMSFKRQQGKRASECGARLMSDVCYVGITTPGGAKYFQLVQDEASRFKWVFLLKKKSGAGENVMGLIRQLEKDFQIRTFSCDQGGEFLNDKFSTFLSEHGIRLTQKRTV
ncbi:hypothetical protein PI124_g4818 [Phytophthora idaei]|nr:hypothetical protein PI125_g2331 [Phytophthora idaei]KAG3165741.1 hypothetical protein PI126_g4512 [Phytophthora idaei]KAG3250567.1 hypothetical protein PI124_g4818 [Phytophthora idaei]